MEYSSARRRAKLAMHPDTMPCGEKVTNFIETTLVPQCTYEMNKLDGVRLDLFLQKAILRMANVDLLYPPISPLKGFKVFCLLT
jgi:hypothetical protein